MAAPGRCPHCHAQLSAGQETCIECGYDLARRYRRAPSWKIWAVAGVIAALAVGVGAGIGVSALANRHDHRSRTFTTTNAAAPAPAPAPAPGATAPATPVVPTTAAPATPTVPTTPSPSGGTAAPSTSTLATWPANTTAYTVVLATTKTRSQALAKAREAQGRGIGGVGVLDSKSFSSLPRGTFVVFTGRYPTVNPARSAADGYATQGFSGAYPLIVRK